MSYDPYFEAQKVYPKFKKVLQRLKELVDVDLSQELIPEIRGYLQSCIAYIDQAYRCEVIKLTFVKDYEKFLQDYAYTSIPSDLAVIRTRLTEATSMAHPEEIITLMTQATFRGVKPISAEVITQFIKRLEDICTAIIDQYPGLKKMDIPLKN